METSEATKDELLRIVNNNNINNNNNNNNNNGDRKSLFKSKKYKTKKINFNPTKNSLFELK